MILVGPRNDDSHQPGKEKTAKEQIYRGFKAFYESMLTLIEQFSTSTSECSRVNAVQTLTLKRDKINSKKDGYQRTILHVAVEERNIC